MRLIIPVLLLSCFTSIDTAQLNDFQTQVQLAVDTLAPFRTHIQEWSRAASPSEGLFNCDLCTAFIALARELVPGRDKQFIVDIVVYACQLLDLAPRDNICEPIINAYADQFLYIMSNVGAESYNGTEICSLLTLDCESVHPEMTNWDVEVLGQGQDFNELVLLPESSLSIVQFTDVHLDLDYKVGAPTQCGDRMPICCRESEGELIGDDPGAEKYGHNRCGMAMDGWDALLLDASQRVQNPPFLLLTGDYTHSGVWLYSEQENSRHISAVTSSLLQHFSTLTPAIYPVVGNHEPHVVNMYAPSDLWSIAEFSLEWMYSATMNPFLEAYPDLLPPEEVERFMKGGYYTVIPPGTHNLRLVVLNTNVCSLENFWLGYRASDPEGQLRWVNGVLEVAEQQNQRVLVVGHIEPGSCWGYWSQVWNKIVLRFRGIITAQLYGHSHKPHFRVAFRNGTLDPISLSFVAGSALPDRMNPGYKVYQLDGARGQQNTWSVLNHQLVLLKLNESNAAGTPIFEVIDAVNDLGMGAVANGTNVLDWAKNLICNQQATDNYLRYHYKGTDSPDYSACSVLDRSCMRKLLCDLVSSNAWDKTACDHLGKLLDTSVCEGENNTSQRTTTPTDNGSSRQLAPPSFILLILILGATYSRDIHLS